MSLYITHDALDLTIQGHPLLDMRPSLYWDPAPTPRTCSNLFFMKHVRLSSGWFASYWNAFLFVVMLDLYHFRLLMLEVGVAT